MKSWTRFVTRVYYLMPWLPCVQIIEAKTEYAANATYAERPFSNLPFSGRKWWCMSYVGLVGYVLLVSGRDAQIHQWPVTSFPDSAWLPACIPGLATFVSAHADPTREGEYIRRPNPAYLHVIMWLCVLVLFYFFIFFKLQLQSKIKRHIRLFRLVLLCWFGFQFRFCGYSACDHGPGGHQPAAWLCGWEAPALAPAPAPPLTASSSLQLELRGCCPDTATN